MVREVGREESDRIYLWLCLCRWQCNAVGYVVAKATACQDVLDPSHGGFVGGKGLWSVRSVKESFFLDFLRGFNSYLRY